MAGRRQFGLKHLLVAVAVCAVVFAIARWSVEVAVAIVTASAGYAIDRRRGQPGISGAMLGGAIGACLAVTLITAGGGTPVTRLSANYENAPLIIGTPGGLFAGLLVFMALARMEPAMVAWYRGRQNSIKQVDEHRTSSMNFNPLRWNVFHLMLAVAFCAVLFALWKIWPGLAVSVAAAVGGFAIDKHQEGPGMGGAMLGGGCGSVAYSVVWVVLSLIGGPAPFGMAASPLMFSGIGFAFMLGVVTGLVVYGLMLPTLRAIDWISRKGSSRRLRAWPRKPY